LSLLDSPILSTPLWKKETDCAFSIPLFKNSLEEAMLDIHELPMRLAVGQLNQLTDEAILFAKQLGIIDIQFNMYHGVRCITLASH
jgi:hypothetical protein